MAGWLKKTSSPSLPAKRAGLPVQQKQGNLVRSLLKTKKGEKIPNASLIYGVGSACLFVICLYYFFTGGWLIGFLISLLAIGLLGHALHFMGHL